MAQNPDAFSQLKTRVKSAVHEIDKLQTDNKNMSATIKEILGDKKVRDSEIAIVLDTKRDVLRGQLKKYISTIDKILQEG